MLRYYCNTVYFQYYQIVIINVTKKVTKRERRLVAEWLMGRWNYPQLGQKLGKSKIGALSTIARVFKHNHHRHE